MNGQLSRRLRLARFFMATPARRHTLLRLGIVNSLGIPYYRRYGRGISSFPANGHHLSHISVQLELPDVHPDKQPESDHERPPWYDPKRELPVEKWAAFFRPDPLLSHRSS